MNEKLTKLTDNAFLFLLFLLNFLSRILVICFCIEIR